MLLLRRRLPEEAAPPPLDAFWCGECTWMNMGFDCGQRAAYLTETYGLTEEEARVGIMEEGSCIDPDYVPADSAGGVWAGALDAEASRDDAVAETVEEAASGTGADESSPFPTTGALVALSLGVAILVFTVALVVQKRRQNKTMWLNEDQRARDRETDDEAEGELKKEERPARRLGTQETAPMKDDSMNAGIRFADEEDPTNRSPLFDDKPAHHPRLDSPETLPRSRSPSPEPEPQIWIQVKEQENMNACDQSILTFDDDWSHDPVKGKSPDAKAFVQDDSLREIREDASSHNDAALDDMKPPEILKDIFEDVNALLLRVSQRAATLQELDRIAEPDDAQDEIALHESDSGDPSQDGTDCSGSDRTVEMENVA